MSSVVLVAKLQVVCVLVFFFFLHHPTLFSLFSSSDFVLAERQRFRGNTGVFDGELRGTGGRQKVSTGPRTRNPQQQSQDRSGQKGKRRHFNALAAAEWKCAESLQIFSRHSDISCEKVSELSPALMC